MALADAIAGALRPAQVITWTRGDGTPEDLTNATITGILLPDGGAKRNIAGTLTATSPTLGIFQWDYALADVVAGEYLVQFNAAFAQVPSPAKTRTERWRVLPSL